MVLAVAAVLSLSAAALTAVGAWMASSSGPRANQAFVDERATGELVGQITNAVSTIYSYDYHNLGATEDAAKNVITGGFAEEFDQVFDPVKRLAPAQQAILRTSVPAAGVKLLRDDDAQLLMMVNQSGTRGPEQEPTGAAARLVVEAQKVDGRWKISGVGSE
jgi:Mce-associated membrane protein